MGLYRVYWRRKTLIQRIPVRVGEERDMRLTRNRVIGAALVVLVAVLGIGQHLLEKEAIAQTTGKVMVPKFEVDPFWPKPMPNNWVFGQTIGLGIDEKGSGLDHPSRERSGQSRPHRVGVSAASRRPRRRSRCRPGRRNSPS
jgi:hypothetical protein